jgi:hypothetical protein
VILCPMHSISDFNVSTEQNQLNDTDTKKSKVSRFVSGICEVDPEFGTAV